MSAHMKFHVVLEESPEGGYTASCVEIPGAISEGETVEEALENVADAISMVLGVRRQDARRAVEARRGHLETVDVDA